MNKFLVSLALSAAICFSPVVASAAIDLVPFAMQVQQKPVMKTVYIDAEDDFHYSIWDNPAPETYLLRNIIIRVCRLSAVSSTATFQPDCRFIVPAAIDEGAYTVYSDTPYTTAASWSWFHMPPATILRAGRAYRICPLPLVKSSDTRPTCQYLKP